MNKHKTVEVLEEIHNLIAKFKEFINSGDQFEAIGAEMNLRDAIEKAYDDGIISENMHNDYLQLLDGYERDELPERLEEKTDENINIVEQADDQIAKSLDLGERADDNAEHNVDSKTDLQYIKDVMNQYWHERDEKEGVLSAVDKFTEIGDAIKKALEEKKISRMTAVELMEPLREIKDNMCDIDKQNAALDRFEEIINNKLAREDERDSQSQQQDQQQANESILGSAGTVIGRTIKGVTEALKTIHDKTEEQAQRAADEYDRQQAQKEAERNKSPLSPEQIEQFESLKKEFLRRYQRAQVYHRNFQSKDWPVSAPFWENTVGAMEPLANMFKGLDLKEVTDTKQLDDLARQWGKTMADMSQVYNWLDNQRAYDGAKYTDDVAYDDVWGNRDELDDAAKQFFTGIGLNQQQEKAPQKKEYVKPETKVEQKQPQEPVMQQQKPTQSQEKVIIKPVAGTPQGSVDTKIQEKKDITPAPEDLMAREDNSVRGEKQQNPKQEALLKLGELYDKLSSARAAFDENPSSLEALNKANKAWDDFYFSFYRNPNLQDFKSEFNKLMDAAYNMNKTGFPGDEIKKLINKEIKKEFGYEVPLHAASEQQQAPEDIKIKDQTQSQEQKHITPDEVQQQVVETQKPSEIKRGDEKTETKETPHTPDLEKKPKNEDLSQKMPDVMHREDMTNDKVDAGEKKPEDYEDLIYGLEVVLSHHKDRDPESFKRMMFALKDLSQRGGLPEEMKKEYMDVFNRVKEFSNNPSYVEYGATQLDSKIIEPLETLETKQQQVQDGKMPVQNAQYKPDLEKKPENKDLSQKPENLLNRENQQMENSKQHTIENFKAGTQQVVDMDKDKTKGNEIALAAYRRKILERRGNGGNV